MSNNNPFMIPDQKVDINKSASDALQSMGKVQIHTMKKDLESSIGSEQSETTHMPLKSNNIRKSNAPVAAEKQKTSPFLNPTSEETKPSISIKEKNTSPTKTVLMTGIIVFIILVIALGGYYYWITRTEITEESAPMIPIITDTKNETPTEAPVEIPDQPTTVEINAGKPNYLILDIDKLDGSKVKEVVTDHAKRAAELNSSKPIEFIITDSQNNPIIFSKFAEKLELSLSSSVYSYLGNNFILLSYKEKGQPHLGLIIDMKNSADSSKLKDAMLQEEPNLKENIKSLFLIENNTPTNPKYSTSPYGGAAIRFINITSPDELSVDYSVYKSKLLFGTTKKTMHSLIDRINSISAAN